MAKQQRTIRDPFRSIDSPQRSASLRAPAEPVLSIDGAALAWVVGGRITPRKGPDPAVVQGITNLAKTIAEVGQVLSAQKQQGDAQMGQMMQQMMQARGAR